MKRTLIGFLCLLAGMTAFAANDVVVVSATYEYLSNNPDETPSQAEKTAIERARQKALEEQFGVEVSNTTSTLVTSRSEGGRAQSKQDVFAVGGSSVRGEWVETIKEQVIEKNYRDGFWIVKVYVEGRARKNSGAKADIQFAFVKDVYETEAPAAFRDSSDIFLRFSSPVAGYLCVYLVDEDRNVLCMLPYPDQQNGSQAVKANRDYVFFSLLHDPKAQAYTLSSERSSEQNALYVIFSPNEFTKAHDKKGGSNFRGQEMPRGLSYDDFMKWLGKNQSQDSQMIVKTEVITVQKK